MNPTSPETVRQLAIQGFSPNQIARRLNQAGEHTSTGKQWYTKTAKTAVKRVLSPEEFTAWEASLRSRSYGGADVAAAAALPTPVAPQAATPSPADIVAAETARLSERAALETEKARLQAENASLAAPAAAPTVVVPKAAPAAPEAPKPAPEADTRWARLVVSSEGGVTVSVTEYPDRAAAVRAVLAETTPPGSSVVALPFADVADCAYLAKATRIFRF